MALGDSAGTGTCTFCGFERVPLKESKNGGAAGTCPECGAQAFGKTPKAIAASRARQEKKSAGDKAPAERSFAAEIFGESK